MALGGARGVAARLVKVVASALAVTFVAGCGTSHYQYLRATEQGAFFKVPNAWKVFQVDTGLPTDRVLPPGAAAAPNWQVYFDADPAPDINHFNVGKPPSSPVGQAMVLNLNRQSQDQVSNADLRKLALQGQADPVTEYENGNQDFEVLAYNNITSPSGLHGSHLVYNVRNGANGFTTVNQTALLNTAQDVLYAITVVCTAECYKAHQSEIDQIVDSWQIRRK